MFLSKETWIRVKTDFITIACRRWQFATARPLSASRNTELGDVVVKLAACFVVLLTVEDTGCVSTSRVVRSFYAVLINQWVFVHCLFGNCISIKEVFCFNVCRFVDTILIFLVFIQLRKRSYFFYTLDIIISLNKKNNRYTALRFAVRESNSGLSFP